ncbi:MAG: HD domain-containing protein [Actinomycetota bacterium]|nr:HD domain-containing protein [Actinomycetota bacterium]
MPAIPTRSGAAALAEKLLAQLGDRWRHTRGVAARADRLASAVVTDDQELLLVAAHWHDLGYAPELVVTGFHPLDGARFLAGEGYPARLCALIAHHSAAMFEAEERCLADELAAWPREKSAVADALWMADMTTGPRGEAVDYPNRLAEILRRYQPDSIVGRAMSRARPLIEAAIARTEDRLRAATRCTARGGRRVRR